jgi:hypothetical protein
VLTCLKLSASTIRNRGLLGIRRADIFGDMSVTVEMQHTGDAASQREVVAVIEHFLAERPGDWRVSMVGSKGSDRWEMTIAGPNGFERSYTLEGSAGQHDPRLIAQIVARMLPRR